MQLKELFVRGKFPFLKFSIDDPESLFKSALILSIFFHAALWGGFYLKNILFSRAEIPSIEIDLTKPFRIGGNPLLKPGGGTSLEPAKKVDKIILDDTPAKTQNQEKSLPKDWILPTSPSQEVEKPKEESGSSEKGVIDGVPGGTNENAPGTGGGWGGGEGEGGGLPITRLPQMLNRSEVLRLLRKLYPIPEREAGIEGEVIVDLHLGVIGNVISVDVVESSGESFDRAAQEVAKKMRFSPAMIKDDPVAVKIRQRISFKIEE